MAIQNKAEIRIYYESNRKSAKEVAKYFNISYRTLMYWVKNEKWEKGKALKAIEPEVINNDLLKKELISVLDNESIKIKQKIKENLGEVCNEVDETILNNLLDASTDKILIEAMSVNFIHKNIALSAILAKDELMRIIRLKGDNKYDLAVIAGAERVAKIFLDLQTAIYGKDAVNLSALNAKNNNLENLSDAELLALLNKAD
ncbi:hypothetical protein FMM56_00925 [Campylobacter sp. LR264d]|uniref:hypothetical protein n=1 Tax=Campylobacter sp. LR264d TaxID=2593544 RepID=UPI001239E80E|nr:hypothetical protein [Campylobacter sp. LR264d]KAA6234348.1 hypothetical protein FMM56_00925 [Campylobacter sp. LR264d]